MFLPVLQPVLKSAYASFSLQSHAFLFEFLRIFSIKSMASSTRQSMDECFSCQLKLLFYVRVTLYLSSPLVLNFSLVHLTLGFGFKSWDFPLASPINLCNHASFLLGLPSHFLELRWFSSINYPYPSVVSLFACIWLTITFIFVLPWYSNQQ